ncbi:MAG: N(G),N(G)-dimethylarginine dimethylaminohydrolase [Candidatus Heimdallarchaeota archaeon AB_125]|nr:MAG: N(G),N(G)-dimethylarginine dimethylaminohydrolase [Candidatus Heimdallarchaeota archaeon AB_125]
MNTKKAIVREPGKSYTNCVTSHPLGHTVDFSIAKEQHKRYCSTLSELGLELIKLAPKDHLPDSCFVEDNAVVHGTKALITRMAIESRRGEDEDVEELLQEHFSVKRATDPATIEGGDVVHLPDKLVCGITQRTNQQGVEQLRSWMDITVSSITNLDIVHLKSYIKYLGKETVITTADYKNHPLLKNLKLVIIPKEEYYSINCLPVADTVIMSDKYSFAKKAVLDAGFDVVSLNMSEFEKCQASLTCLSILF